MPRVFSGIQPSGELHIGNLLGAVQNWVALQERYECIYCVVDLHAITFPYERELLSARTREMAISLLAAGIDPTRSILFVQSHVPEHAQLQWLLNAVSPLGDLERMTQFKDKAQRLETVPSALLQYPVLQAADILLYRADVVPVGEDQAQHLELTREIARRWNQQFAPEQPYFPEPQALHTEVKRLPGLDGKAKMSKTLGNTIGITESPEAIWEKLRPTITDPARVKRTDPGEPLKCPVIYPLHRYFSPPDVVDLVERNCRGAGWGCIECKRVLADHLIAALAPIRQRVLELQQQPDEVDRILAEGAERARAIARVTLREAKQRMGFFEGRS
ncbi:MAG TPA: tryptophan--tRNA ligase [Gemmatimonadales bacterium]|nr:tryptophan--tRNA ligase [Gemmatimonadales bacterium]